MSAESVLQWARPRETVVSGGRRARRPEVTDMLSVTGSGVHNTALHSAIEVKISGNGNVSIRSWDETDWIDH